MRLDRLEIQAFGAYAGTETIDFATVRDKPLLLIHGPTGSGKTTVLDAMCFALFGETSGAERTGAQMRCDLAQDDVLTRVVFEFSLGARRLRVVREPEQQRPARRGGGTTRHSHAAWLWDLTGAGDGEGVLLEQKAGDVSRRVGELLGFSEDQFRQVVVLPQGRFRELLTAKSDDKEKILKALFNTALYERISAELKRRRQEVAAACEAQQNQAAGMLAAVGVGTAEELEEHIQALAARVDALQQAEPPARQAAEGARARLDAAREAARRLAAAEEARRALDALRVRDDAVAELRARRDLAAQAAPLVELADGAAARRREAAEAERGLEVAAATELQRTEAARAAEAELEARRAEAPAREAAQREEQRLDALVDAVRALATARAEAAAAARDEASAARARDAAAREGEQQAAAVGAAAAEREQLARVGAQQGELELQLQRAQRTEAKAQALVVERRRYGDLSRRVAEAAKKAAEQARELAAARAAAGQVEGLWREGQAGALARSLVPGVPCPVCGALEHPTPARPAHDLPTEGDLDAARSRVDALDRARAAADAAHAELTAEQRVCEERGRGLREELAQELAVPFDQVAQLPPETLRERAAQAARARDEAARANVRLAKLLAEQPALEQAAAAAAARALDAAEGATRATAALAATRALVQEREGLVPEALRDAGALEQARTAATKRRRALEQAHEAAVARAREAAATLAGARAAHEAAGATVGRAGAAADDAEATLAERRRGQGLTDDATFAAARADAGRVGALDAEIRQHETAVASAAGALSEARARAEGQEPGDITALEAAQGAAQRELEGVQADRAAGAQDLAHKRKVHGNHARAAAEAVRTREALAQLSAVASVALGDNPRRTSFQRFVLAALLDDVLRLASERLHHMSQGRYRLLRSDDVVDRRSAAGLDLVVTDSYSGASRPVGTLSGGESFMAALALSLGLSDVVQAYAGGIHLDTLFIDEGFGTLDPESLDRALDVLTALNQGGRLIGIISHVQELRTRIDTRLEVVPTDRGSTTRLTVG